jgi:hypothetical protein
MGMLLRFVLMHSYFEEYFRIAEKNGAIGLDIYALDNESCNILKSFNQIVSTSLLLFYRAKFLRRVKPYALFQNFVI